MASVFARSLHWPCQEVFKSTPQSDSLPTQSFFLPLFPFKHLYQSLNSFSVYPYFFSSLSFIGVITNKSFVLLTLFPIWPKLSCSLTTNPNTTKLPSRNQKLVFACWGRKHSSKITKKKKLSVMFFLLRCRLLPYKAGAGGQTEEILTLQKVCSIQELNTEIQLLCVLK